MIRQFTSTVYIIHQGKTLMIKHKKFGKWLPPGGHMEPNEIPSEAAKREALEETGLHVEFYNQENVWVERWNASSFPRPYLCLLGNIPAYGDQPEHQHIDFVYIGYPVGGQETFNERESDQLHWFTPEEIEQLESDVEIFEEVKITLRKIFGINKSPTNAGCCCSLQ